MRFRDIGLAAASLALISFAIGSSRPTHAADAPYQLVQNWARLPNGLAWGPVAGVATDARGNVYAFRRAEPPIFIVDRTGAFVRTSGDTMFAKPHGIRFDERGFMWITDQGPNNVVVKMDPRGNVLLTLGKKGVGGDGPDTFNGPTDVVVAADGAIFVADGEFNHRVLKFSSSGTFIKQWGAKGDGPGEFLVPHALALDSRGRVFVADRDNKRVQIFDQDGKFIDQWSHFGSPSGIFITKDDTLYVLSTAAEKRGISMASARDGKVTGFVETSQNGLHLLAVDSGGAIYAAGLGGSGLVKFARN
jgi:DNA-binding beta-propeller fold protein YncE